VTRKAGKRVVKESPHRRSKRVRWVGVARWVKIPREISQVPVTAGVAAPNDGRGDDLMGQINDHRFKKNSP